MRYLAVLGVLTLALIPSRTVSAEASTGLRIAPQKYQETLRVGDKKAGVIDVVNMADARVAVRVRVARVTQSDQNGNLQFRSDERLEKAISPDATEFELEPKAGRRVGFVIDSAILGSGGAYGAVLFSSEQVVAGAQGAGTSTIRSQVGTLLLLNVGGQETTAMTVGLRVPRLQFGTHVTGNVVVANADGAESAVAVMPELSVASGLLQKSTHTLPGHLVLPGASRLFDFSIPKNAFGLQRVSVLEKTSGSRTATYVFVCTGWYRLLMAAVVLVGVLLLSRRKLVGRLRKNNYARGVQA